MVLSFYHNTMSEEDLHVQSYLDNRTPEAYHAMQNYLLLVVSSIFFFKKK